MLEPKEVTVLITFQPPPRRESVETSEPHERVLQSVPLAVAEKMTANLMSYRKGNIARYQTYNYESGSSDGEALVALDLGEVVKLRVKPDPVKTLEGSYVAVERPVAGRRGERAVLSL